jgi:hypothetical protein
MLPAASETTHSDPVPGMSVRGKESLPAKKLGWSAARRYNEVGGVGAKA